MIQNIGKMLNKGFIFLFFALLFFAIRMAFPSYASAASYVTEDITGDTTWTAGGSPYIITLTGSNTTPKVCTGATLTIESGVTVQLGNGTVDTGSGNRSVSQSLEIAGTIHAAGAAFTYYDAISLDDSYNQWGALFFLDGSGGVFQDCTFEKGGAGAATYGMVMVNGKQNVSLSFSGGSFSNGIAGSSSRTGGIYFNAGSGSLDVSGTEFASLGQSVQVSRDTAKTVGVDIDDCVISSCATLSGDWAAMSVRGGAASVTNCSFSGNGKTDLDMYDGYGNGPYSIRVTDNTFNGSGNSKYPMTLASRSRINQSVSSCGNTYENYPSGYEYAPVYSNIPAGTSAYWGDTGLDYLITARMYVEASSSQIGSLTIAPGQTVLFNTVDSGSPAVLNLLGSITAEGTASKLITFKAYDTSVPTGSINAISSGSYYSEPFRGYFTFNHCIFDSLKNGIYIPTANKADITLAEIGLSVKNSTFTGISGDAVYIRGNAYTSANTTVEGCQFNANGGYGIRLNGYAYNDKCGMLIQDSGFRNHTTTAAIYLLNADMTMEGGTIAQNAGAVYFSSSDSTMKNCLIFGNSDIVNSGTTYGAVYAYSADLGLENCTVAGNSAAGLYGYSSNLSILNSILWGNQSYDFMHYNPGSYTVTMNYSCIDKPSSNLTSLFSSAAGRISSDPCFVSSSSDDYHLRSAAGHWNTATSAWTTDSDTSPCVDAGDPASDCSAEPEPNGNRVNIGAYGNTAYASKSVTEPPSDTIPPTVPSNLRSTGVTENQITLSWDASTDTGGIEEYILEMKTGSGTFSEIGTTAAISYAKSALSPGTTYVFRVRAKDTSDNVSSWSAELSAATQSSSGGSGGGGGGGGGSSSDTSSLKNAASIIIDGNRQTFGTSETTSQNGKTVTTVTLTAGDLDATLGSAGNGAAVTIPITGSDTAVGSFDGRAVKNLESKEAIIEIDTDMASYTLPASEINIGAISDQFGENVSLEDIIVEVSISEPSDATVKIVENAAEKGGFEIAVPAVEFTVNCTFNNKTVSVDAYHSYVERLIAIPDGTDPGKITTGIVVEPDGSIHHVPTEIVLVGGAYFAKICSLTNSVYLVVYHPVEFADVEKHWAKDAINDMGSRFIVSGAGNNRYDPYSDITRAEFAAILVRALGLEAVTGSSRFSDVSDSDWYCPYVEAAASNNLILGSGGAFKPNDKITREQAMAITARAMKMTGIEPLTDAGGVNSLLTSYTDASSVSAYAENSVAICLGTGIINGTGKTIIAPRDYVTRAEVAVIMQRLLENSDLI